MQLRFIVNLDPLRALRDFVSGAPRRLLGTNPLFAAFSEQVPEEVSHQGGSFLAEPANSLQSAQSALQTRKI